MAEDERNVWRCSGMRRDDMRELRLPSNLCERVEQRFGSRFDNLEEFLTRVLVELLRDDSAQMDEAEQRLIEKRLQDLGYL